MHAVIFLGFMALLVRKVQLLVIGYDESFVYPGLAGGMFASFKDLVELAVLSAVGYALWRRLVQKPARLERNREALVILSLIAAIMVTDFMFDGFRFALKAPADPGIAHERSYAFAGEVVARLFSGLSPDQLAAGYQTSYWTQMLTVLSFLVILPLGEHFHISLDAGQGGAQFVGDGGEEVRFGLVKRLQVVNQAILRLVGERRRMPGGTQIQRRAIAECKECLARQIAGVGRTESDDRDARENHAGAASLARASRVERLVA